MINGCWKDRGPSELLAEFIKLSFLPQPILKVKVAVRSNVPPDISPDLYYIAQLNVVELL